MAELLIHDVTLLIQNFGNDVIDFLLTLRYYYPTETKENIYKNSKYL